MICVLQTRLFILLHSQLNVGSNYTAMCSSLNADSKFLISFLVDAANAGSGNLEIMVNDGTIPCSVQNRGNRQFHASFMPKEAIPHQIQMRFNGREVPGELGAKVLANTHT